jgi:ATP-dependent Clp protease adaptor protein ClpS
MSKRWTEQEGSVVAEPAAQQKTREPVKYRVLLHNDNYTTMDFVVEIIIQIFHKPAAEATKLMLEVHKKGSAIAGIYPYDIALTKVNEVHALAKKNEFPLRCSTEEA